MWPFKKPLKPEVGKTYKYKDGNFNLFGVGIILIKVIEVRKDIKGETWIKFKYLDSLKVCTNLWSSLEWEEYQP